MQVSMQTTGIDKAIAHLSQKAKAFRDMTPPYKKWAAEIVKKTDDSFDASRGYDGEVWEPLAEITIEKRVGSLKAANKRTKSGKLTKGAKKMRDAMMAPGGIKPLIDTARARNSNHADVSKDGVEWAAVGYLGYHMSGTERVPERNPSPFLFAPGSNPPWRLRDSASKSLMEHIQRHINGGTP